MLRLELFGAAHAWYEDRPLSGFPSQYPNLLLCYLVLNRRLPHQRDRLAAIFWDDHSTHEARKYLRHVLWRLRHSLEAVGAAPNQYLSVEEQTVAFLPAAPYLLDTEAFEITLSEYRELRGQQLSEEQVARIERAVRLYTGDLLEEVDADWCLYDREHLRLMYLNALDKLMIYHGSQGDYEDGLQYGEKILKCDNTREKIHQRMMWFYWLHGDRSAAVAQYKRCAQILREEMGIEPMSQTQQLFRQIQHATPDSCSRPMFYGSAPLVSQNPIDPLGSELLRRIHHLQTVVEQSNRELQALEQLVSDMLNDPKPG